MAPAEASTLGHLRYVESQNINMTYDCMIVSMVVDLKVRVRSFDCESRASYVGNSRDSLFFFE